MRHTIFLTGATGHMGSETLKQLLEKPERFPRDYYYREYVLPGCPCKIAVCSTDDEIDSELRMEFKL